MLSKKIPFYYFILCVVLASGITYIAAKKIGTTTTSQTADQTNTNDTKPNCQYDITRLSGFQHISPIISAAQECEAENLMSLKIGISDYIQHEQQVGSVIKTSVYLRRLYNDDWINVNPQEGFHPASLLKVPQLITYLKMAETEAGLLDKQYVFQTQSEALPEQYYSAKSLQPGHKYSVRDMFHFMIVYSDNNANMELIKRMDMNIFNKTFNDLKLRPPSLKDGNYTITSKDYSKFLEVLYNAAYLSNTASEYATELLAEAAFKDGIIKKIPRTVQVAHKMGEWGDGKTVELHDCGIVYIDKNPYIVTIMTKGADMERLSEVIANISKMIYDAMLAQPS